MKKLYTFLFAAFLGFAAYSQSSYPLTDVQLDGNEVDTMNFTLSGHYASVALSVRFTEVGGTSDGTCVLQYRPFNDYTESTDEPLYVTLDPADFTGFGNTNNNDTVTITDGGAWTWIMQDPPQGVYRLLPDGTASDTTTVEAWYSISKQ